VRCITADLSLKRLPNKDLARVGLMVGALYGALIVASWWNEAFSWEWSGASDAAQWRLWASHAAVSAALGLGLWLLKIWPAGDAKLFLILAAALPLAAPVRLRPSALLPVFLLTNVFVPAAVVFLLKSFVWLWRMRLVHGYSFHRALGRSRVGDYWAQAIGECWREVSQGARARLASAAQRPWEAARSLASAAGLWVFAALTLAHLNLTVPGYRVMGPLIGLAVMAVWRRLSAWLSQETLGGIVAVAVFAAILSGGEPFWEVFRISLIQWSFFGLLFEAGTRLLRRVLKAQEGFSTFLALAGFAGSLGLFPVLFPFAFTGGARILMQWSFFGVVLGALYTLVGAAMEENVTYCPAARIHPRLVLAGSAWESIRQDEDFYRENFRWRYPDGLTDGQAASLRRWCQERSIQALAVRETEPFALWMFAGTALTLLLGRDVIGYGIRLFS